MISELKFYVQLPDGSPIPVPLAQSGRKDILNYKERLVQFRDTMALINDCISEKKGMTT